MISGYIPSHPMPGFYNRFTQTVERYPQVTAVEMQHSLRPGAESSAALETFTYYELRRMAESIAHWFASQRGLPDGIKGARCAILAANGPRWVAAYLGILAAGAVAVPLDTAFTADQVYKLLTDSGTSLLFVDGAHLAVGMAAAARLQIKIVLLEKTDVAADAGLPDIDAMFAAGPADFQAATVRAEELAVILYTSGTTSDPKGVMLTHGNVDAEAESVFKFIEVGPTDGVLAVLPLFHALAQMANLMLPFAAGAKVVYLDALNTTELVRALRERDITIFACVPQFFYLIHERVMKQVGEKGALEQFGFKVLMQVCRTFRSFGWNLGKTAFAKVHDSMGKKLRYFITGGSRFDAEIGRDLESMGFTILQAYGLTETTGAAFITPPGKNVVGSVGQPLPGLEARIVFAGDPDSGALNAGAPNSGALDPHHAGAAVPGTGDNAHDAGDDDEPVAGEIVVRGGMVTPGYYHRRQATDEVLRDGWFYTGDLGYFDSHGNLFITGRQKDVIVLSSGKNIYPEELEAHYLKSIFIKELCVLGLESKPGEPVSERLHAVVVPDFDVLRERQIVNMGEVIRYDIENLSVELPATKRILSYDIWQEDLPRTTTRKLKRFQIRNRVMGNAAAASSFSPGSTESAPRVGDEDSLWLGDPQVIRALAVIRGAAKKELRELRPSDNLELDLGLDSMERVELLVALEEEFGVHLDEQAVAQVYTVRELVDAVRAGSENGQRRDGFSGWESLLAVEPDDPEVLAIAVEHRVMTPLWFLFGRLVNLFTRDIFHLHIEGLEKLPRRGPFILCPNHQSFLDAPLLVAQLPYSLYRDLFYVGTSEIFGSGAMRRLARSLKLIPVDPDANLVPAMRAGAFGLRKGHILVMYPEGERSIDGVPKTFKKGAAILSLHLQVPIYPVALDGFFQSWPRGQKFAGPHPLRIKIGDPILPPQSLENPEAKYVALTNQLRTRVMDMWEQIQQPKNSAS